MKNLLHCFSILAFWAAINALGQSSPSYDDCAYTNTPPSQKLKYGTWHVVADYTVDDGCTPTNYTYHYDTYSWGSTNAIAQDYYHTLLGLGYGCGGYGADPTSAAYGLAIDLNEYMDGTLVWGNIESITENHTSTSFNVSLVTTNNCGNSNGPCMTTITETVSGNLVDTNVDSNDANPGDDHGDGEPCCTCPGMPRWFITEPYMNLWIKDTPVLYRTSLGKDISFGIAWKQHDTRPLNTTVPPTGWSHNWFSYVHFVVPACLSSTNNSVGVPMPGSTGPVKIRSGWTFTNDFSQWQAILYATDDGEDYFDNNSSSESKTGLTLLPLNGSSANGFRLVHPDGTVDEYSLVSSPVFTFGMAKEGGRRYDLGVRSPRLISSCGNTYYSADGSSYMQAYSDPNTEPPIGQQVAYVALDAVLTKRTDPYGNSIYLTYNSSAPYYLQSILDYDGNTTSLTYDGSGMLKQVSMPYGRSASFTYSGGQLASVTDAQGMTSTFTYNNFTYTGKWGDDTNIYLTSMTTPYGTTSFSHYEAPPIVTFPDPPYIQHNYRYTGGGGTTVILPTTTSKVYVGWYGGTNRVNKACTVTHPDGTHELYVYRYDSTGLVPSTYSTSPFSALNWGNGDDGIDQGSDFSNDPSTINHLLSTRNSFHWNRQQYALLSTNDPSHLSAHDYKLATMKHWLETDSQQSFYPQNNEENVCDQLSFERAASPDGVQDGAITWHYHSGQSWWISSGDYSSDAEAVVLPNGDICYKTTSFSSGLLSSINESYTTKDGNNSTRNWSYGYNSVPVYDASNNYLYQYYQLNGVSFPYGGYYFNYASDNSEMDVSDSEGGMDSYFYNSRHQITGIKHANGLTTTNLYGANGFLSRSIDVESQATNSYTFAYGLPATTVNALGLQLGYAWDNLGRLTQISYPDGTTVSNNYYRLDIVDHKDRLNHWTHASYDSMRQMRTSTDANGGITQYGYCFCGGLASITDPLTDATVYNRDYDGNIIAATSSDGFTTTYTRNIVGQVVNVVDSAGMNLHYVYNNQGLVTNIYNSAGNVYSVAYDDCDRPAYVTDDRGVVVTNVYDTLGRITQKQNVFGIFEQNYYSPQGITQRHDALGNVTYCGYDAAGRLNSTTDSQSNPFHTNGFAYNPMGQISALADGNGHVTSWVYDIYGRVVRKIDGNGVTITTNGYDAEGRLTSYWTPAGGTTRYTYDANNNPLTVVYSTGTSITATYDALNRIKTMVDGIGASAFAYQNFGAFSGALATEDGPWASDTVTNSYVNRILQSLTLAQASGNWAQNFGYDGQLRLHTISSPAGSFTYNYNGAGRQIQGLSLPGNNSVAYGYDAAGQMLSTVLKSSGGNVLDSYTYAYDLNGNRTSVQRADNSVVTYGYDNINELTSATATEASSLPRANENFGYLYDAAGNLAVRTNNTLVQGFVTDGANELVNITRSNNLLTVAGSLSSQPTSLTVNGQTASVYGDLTYAVPNGVTVQDGTNTFTAVVNGTLTNSILDMLPVSINLLSDRNGNLTWDGLKTYAYDTANQLTQVAVNGAWKTTYAYDGFGRRRVRQDYKWTGSAWSKTNEVHYVYDGMNVLQERDASNNPLVTYTRGIDLSGSRQDAGGIGGLLSRTDSGGSAYYHADGNGNITMMVDASGSVQAKYLYDSFGNTLGMWGTLAPTNTYRFSSKEVDLKSGLYYYDFRYYEPNLQRWLSRDPIEEEGGINLYEYVDNNPINEIDPLGLDGAAAALAFEEGGGALAAEEEGGWFAGGNFNPWVDGALLATAVGTLGYAGYEYFQPAKPTVCEMSKRPSRNADREGHKGKRNSDKHENAQNHGGREKPNMQPPPQPRGPKPPKPPYPPNKGPKIKP